MRYCFVSSYPDEHGNAMKSLEVSLSSLKDFLWNVDVEEEAILRCSHGSIKRKRRCVGNGFLPLRHVERLLAG